MGQAVVESITTVYQYRVGTLCSSARRGRAVRWSGGELFAVREARRGVVGGPVVNNGGGRWLNNGGGRWLNNGGILSDLRPFAVSALGKPLPATGGVSSGELVIASLLVLAGLGLIGCRHDRRTAKRSAPRSLSR